MLIKGLGETSLTELIKLIKGAAENVEELINESSFAEVVWYGAEAPDESKYKLWFDESSDPTILRYQDKYGSWKQIGGAGGSSSASAVAISPVSDLSQDISADDECDISFEWSTNANESSKGTVTVYVNSTRKYTGTHEQGEVTIPVQKYLVTGKTNDIKVVVKDIYGTENSISFTVAVISITVSSSFKQNTILKKETYPESYAFPIVVRGGLYKTVHVVLNGVEVESSSIDVSAMESGVQKYVTIPSCSHGVHSLEIYATALISGKTLTSNHIYYDLIWTEEGCTDILIASSFRRTEADQFEILDIPHFVYNPVSETSEVFYEVNGELTSTLPKNVGRTEQKWETSSELVGENIFRIISGGSERVFKLTLAKVETVDVSIVTDELLLCLAADNNHDNTIVETRDVWKSTGEADVSAEFNDFNWITNGWTTVDGAPALNVSGGASLRIPYKIFEGALVNGKDTEIKDVGCTVEVEFCTNDVTDAKEPFLSCMSGGKGISIAPEEVYLKSSGASLSTEFERNMKMKMAFVISPEDPGIMYLYINGNIAGAETYTSSDRFKQDTDPADLLISSEGCSVNIFSVRVYRTPLLHQQVMYNWIADIPSIADRVNAYKRNDIFDSITGEVQYSKALTKLPCMTYTGVVAQYKGDKRIVDIKFEGTNDGLYDFILRGAQDDVQGTSSQFLPLKNRKFKSEYKTTDENGKTVKVKKMFEMLGGEVDSYSLGENQIPAKVFCLKIDFMEHSSSHNTETARQVNEMYSQKTPPQKLDSRVRTTIYGRPILVFFKETEDSEPVFGGKFNFNYDKDAEAVFGFEEDASREVVECVEFCNNTSQRCLLQKSEYLEKTDAPIGFDEELIDENGQVPAYLTDFEFRYQWRRESTNNVTYSYLKAFTDWVVSTDRKAATGEALAEPYVTNKGIANYLYDINQNIVTFVDGNGVTRKAIDIGLGVTEFAYEEHSVVETDEDGNEVTTTYYALPIDDSGNEVYSFTHDTAAYRLTKFVTELEEHCNEHFALMYFLNMDIRGMVDSGTKNCFIATWGERHEKHPAGTDYSVIWYFIFYDMDTMFGLTNVGKKGIPYDAEFGTKIEGSDLGYAFNGSDNVFWNNIKDGFTTELKALLAEKIADGTFSKTKMLEGYEEHARSYPEAVSNVDAKIKYVDPYVDGYYGYSEDSKDQMVLQHPNNLFAAHGYRTPYRVFWVNNRYYFILSKNIVGSYQTDYITMRLYSPENMVIPANADFTVTTWANIYVNVKYGSKTVKVKCLKGVPTLVTAPADKFNDTETIIYGASRITSLGSLASKYARSYDFSKAPMLGVVDIGSDVEGYGNTNLDEVSFGSNPMLQEVYVQNCPKLDGTLGLGKCPIVKIIKAHGSAISLLDVVEGGVLEEVTLPVTMAELKLINHPKLTKFSIEKTAEGTYNLGTIRVENTPIDTVELIKNSPSLTRIRVTGVNWTMDDDELLRKIKDNFNGFTASGSDDDRPVIMGDVHVTNIKDYLKDEIDSFFNNGVAVENLPELSKRDFRLTAKNVVQTHLVRFFDGVSDEPMASGITDNRVIRNGFAHYNGNTPVKEEDWAKTYAFSSWGVYVDGELTAIEDISAYPITADTDFYAIYAETKKIFTINFYRQNSDTGYYDLYKSEQIPYDGTVTAGTFPDEFAHEDYALRFKGWSTTAGASEAQVVPGGIIAVTEGSPYEQDYFAVYTVDYKHRINFVDYDGTTIKDTVIYYKGDTVVIPADPTRSPTVENVFSFIGWSLNGVDVIEIPTVGGNTYNITYKAVYSDELRPYTIQFVDYNGTVLKTETVRYSMTPTPPEAPTREETAQYFYDFDGWDKEVSAVTGDTVYTATYLATLRTYTVNWKNEDGTILESDINVSYGTMPTYDGATPTKKATAQYSYTFKGWHIAVSQVTGNITYEARYTSTVNKYKVTWKNYNGTILETDTTEYGKLPTYDGTTPTKVSTAQYDFVFAGWDTAVSEVTGDVVYTATYTEHIRSYEVKFVDHNGTVLSTQSVEYGSMPTYAGNTPSRDGYDFNGWSPALVTVTGETTYTAQYKIKTYIVKFVDFNGAVLSEQTVNHGSIPTAPTNPTREGYTFTGWDKSVVTATSDVTYTAQYKIKTYTITWTLAGATATTTCEHGSTPTPPDGVNVGDILNIGGVNYTVTGYSPNIGKVTGDTLYKVVATTPISTTLTARPTKVGAKSANTPDTTAFLNNTGKLDGGYRKEYYVHFYGFNFEELRGQSNIVIEDISLSVTGAFSYTKDTFKIQFVKDFNLSGSNYQQFTDLGDGEITVNTSGSDEGTNSTIPSSSFSNTLSWIRGNVTDFLNGYNSNTFGIYFINPSTATLRIRGVAINLKCTFTKTVVG